MVTRTGPLATLDREPRQARKGAAATVGACAGVRLVRVATQKLSRRLLVVSCKSLVISKNRTTDDVRLTTIMTPP